MKASNGLWKNRIGDRIPSDLGGEIDVFENEMALKRQSRIEDRIFAETRLRRGVYGQRYDNGHRHDGLKSQTLDYPAGELTKGPDTAWDAPGMQRIKIPWGGVNAEQIEVLADLAEEYSDGISHITTRQDVQLHFIHMVDTPDLMRRLAAVGITTREACGNSVRNVTTCPVAGVCTSQEFDVTPYARALTYFLLGHPDVQDFGRKFKVAFSGCRHEACGLVRLHDLGAVGVTREVNGETQRGFELYVGGGLGSVPHQAKVFADFLPPEELLPIAQAISRVYARLGEKRNRAAARIKFLVAKLGLEEFQRLVWEERAKLDHDPRWTGYLEEAEAFEERPLRGPGSLDLAAAAAGSGEYAEWLRTNVYAQSQPGYATVTIALPLGDITSTQMRAVADMARKYIKETVRTTVEQNLVLRWVSTDDLAALHEDLKAAPLAAPGAGTIVDITACPGTDTCKLGIASSRGLAGELRERLLAKSYELDQVIPRAAHQGERLLQLVRPAPRGRPRLLRRQPQAQQDHRAALPGGARRPVAGERRLLRAGDGRGAVAQDSGGGGAHHHQLPGRPAGRGELPGLHPPHRQGAVQEDAGGSDRGAHLRGGQHLLQRLGRPARVHHRRHGYRRVRRRGGGADRLPAYRRRAGGVRGAAPPGKRGAPARRSTPPTGR